MVVKKSLALLVVVVLVVALALPAVALASGNRGAGDPLPRGETDEASKMRWGTLDFAFARGMHDTNNRMDRRRRGYVGSAPAADTGNLSHL